MSNIFDLAVANGFDSGFVYEHNLQDLSTITLSPTLDSIVSIANTEGDGTDAEQLVLSSREPRYDQAVLNGIKVCTFQNGGTVQNFDIVGPKQAGIAGAVAYSLFAVIRVEGTVSTNGRIWSNEISGSPNGINFIERNPNTTSQIARMITDFVTDNGETVNIPNSFEDQWMQVTIQWSPARGGIQLRVDQIDEAFNTNAAAQVVTTMTTTSYAKRSNTTTGNIASYDLAQFALFAADLSNNDRQSVENLLKQQWFLPPVTDIAALNFDLKAGPTISALLDIKTPTTMDLVVEPSITSKLAINPSRGMP